MAVIISEFEVLEASKGGGAKSPPPPAAKASISPQDVQRILRHEMHRQRRVRAH